jgi:hypothetical protein
MTPSDAAAPRWSPDDLDLVGAAEELRIAPVRRDGTPLSRFRRIWVVRIDDGLFVRSAYGPDSGWFRRIRRSGLGRIRVGDVELDVSVVDVPASDTAAHAVIDAAYHQKYDKYGPRVVGTVVGPTAAGLTLRLLPAPPG